jgi:hypothetical protein
MNRFYSNACRLAKDVPSANDYPHHRTDPRRFDRNNKACGTFPKQKRVTEADKLIRYAKTMPGVATHTPSFKLKETKPVGGKMYAPDCKKTDTTRAIRNYEASLVAMQGPGRYNPTNISKPRTGAVPFPKTKAAGFTDLITKREKELPGPADHQALRGGTTLDTKNGLLNKHQTSLGLIETAEMYGRLTNAPGEYMREYGGTTLSNEGGVIRKAVAPTYTAEIIERSEGPGPGEKQPEFGFSTLNTDGQKFNFSNPKSRLDWIAYFEAQKPSPADYQKPCGESTLSSFGGIISSSEVPSTLELVEKKSLETPAPGSNQPDGGFSTIKVGGGRFNDSNSKSEVEWLMYHAARVPGPGAYSLPEMSENIAGGVLSSSETPNYLELACMAKEWMPAPGINQPEGGFTTLNNSGQRFNLSQPKGFVASVEARAILTPGAGTHETSGDLNVVTFNRRHRSQQSKALLESNQDFKLANENMRAMQALALQDGSGDALEEALAEAKAAAEDTPQLNPGIQNTAEEGI